MDANQYVFVHGCGEIAPMAPPARGCPRGHTAGFRLNDQVSRFQDFRWECIQCGLPQPVMAFRPARMLLAVGAAVARMGPHLLTQVGQPVIVARR